MSATMARRVDRLPDALDALLRRAVTRFVTGSDGSSELIETLQLMTARMPASAQWSSDVAQTFRAIWRATPRPSTKTERQWEAAFDSVAANCHMTARAEPLELLLASRCQATSAHPMDARTPPPS